MPFSTLLLSVATIGTATLALAIAAPASAQEQYAHKPYAHTHYAHVRYRHYAHYPPSRQIVVHAQQPAPVQSQGYAWGPVVAVGNVVGGTGQAVQGVLPAPAPSWAGFSAECLAACRRSSAIRRATHTAPRSPRRSMRPGQWPQRRSSR